MDKYFSMNSSSEGSDDEIFIGNQPLPRETKRRVLLGRRTMSVISVSDESSVELIEMQSEPELLETTLSPETPARAPCRRSMSQPDLKDSPAPMQTWEFKVTDDSFLAMETFVLNMSGNNEEVEKKIILDAEKEKLHSHECNSSKLSTIPTKNNTPNHKKPGVTGKTTMTLDNNFKSPIAPSRIHKPPRSGQKVTPSRSPHIGGPSPFKNVESPIGFYIRNSPQAPLVQTVRPRRPLPGFSAIPKLKDLPARANKENFVSNLPSKAYVNAKQTKLIVKPDAKHLPRNNQVKQMASLLPQVTVMRHEHREKDPTQRSVLPAPDESFAKLSLSQADLSVCVVKSAAVTKTLNRK